jgi:hypothetical protein
MGAGLFVGMAMSVCLLSNPMYIYIINLHHNFGGRGGIAFYKYSQNYNRILLMIINVINSKTKNL